MSNIKHKTFKRGTQSELYNQPVLSKDRLAYGEIQRQEANKQFVPEGMKVVAIKIEKRKGLQRVKLRTSSFPSAPPSSPHLDAVESASTDANCTGCE